MKITKEQRAKVQATKKRADFCYKCKWYFHPMICVYGKDIPEKARKNEKPQRSQCGWWCDNPKAKRFYNYQVNGSEKYSCCEIRGLDTTPNGADD